MIVVYYSAHDSDTARTWNEGSDIGFFVCSTRPPAMQICRSQGVLYFFGSEATSGGSSGPCVFQFLGGLALRLKEGLDRRKLGSH